MLTSRCCCVSRPPSENERSQKARQIPGPFQRAVKAVEHWTGFWKGLQECRNGSMNWRSEEELKPSRPQI